MYLDKEKSKTIQKYTKKTGQDKLANPDYTLSLLLLFSLLLLHITFEPSSPCNKQSIWN